MLGTVIKDILFGRKHAPDGSNTPEQTPRHPPLDFGHLKLSQCLYGWMLYSGPYIGRCFELYGEYSESEVDVLRKYLKAGGVAIDVGANIGDLTIPMARIAGPEGRIFAVESHPEMFNVLCANLALNALANVKPLNHFIADDANVDTASPVWGEHAYTGEVWPVSFIQIDALGLPRCDLIKVDVDGKELEVLRSALKTIEKFHPVLYFENDVREKSPALLEFCFAHGYRLFAHPAPIFRPGNFLGNPVNAWHPSSIVSQMILALPPGEPDVPGQLTEIRDASFWWG